jgi:hypothetical protein
MVSATDHEDAVVGFETIDLIEKVATDGDVHEGVNVLEDKEARGHLAGFEENLADAVLRTHITRKAFDIERLDRWFRTFGDIVHESFGRNCLAILVID